MHALFSFLYNWHSYFSYCYNNNYIYKYKLNITDLFRLIKFLRNTFSIFFWRSKFVPPKRNHILNGWHSMTWNCSLHIRLVWLDLHLYIFGKYLSYILTSIQSNPIRFNPIQFNSIQSNPIRSDPDRSDPTRCDAMRCDPIRFDSIRFSSVQFRSVQILPQLVGTLSCIKRIFVLNLFSILIGRLLSPITDRPFWKRFWLQTVDSTGGVCHKAVTNENE